jgi:hypothetical protein
VDSDEGWGIGNKLMASKGWESPSHCGITHTRLCMHVPMPYAWRRAQRLVLSVSLLLATVWYNEIPSVEALRPNYDCLWP